MTTIPDIFKDPFVVRVRRDGRFATADFTLFPQWFATGTYYLPFVRKKPAPENLATDPYAAIWYTMTHKDFVREKGSVVGGMGRLSPSLALEWAHLRAALMAKVQIEALSGKHKPEEVKDLRFCERGMQFASIALQCAPQTYEGVLLTVTSFQRYFLETLACYDFLTYWKELGPNLSGEPREAAHVVGTLTHEVQVAIEFFELGVPVWLVRQASAFPPSTVVRHVIWPTLDPMELEFMDGSVALWSGPSGAFRNRVCQSLRMANIRLGHSAYQAPPGVYLPVSNQSSFFNLAEFVWIKTHFSFDRRCSRCGNFAWNTGRFRCPRRYCAPIGGCTRRLFHLIVSFRILVPSESIIVPIAVLVADFILSFSTKPTSSSRSFGRSFWADIPDSQGKIQDAFRGCGTCGERSLVQCPARRGGG